VAAPSKAQELLHAYEKGKEAAESLRQRIDSYLDVRGRQFSKAYHPVLEGRLNALLGNENSSPELMAQQEWLSYLRELRQAEQDLLTETPVQLAEVFEAANIIGVRPQFDQYLRLEVETTCLRAGIHAALLIVRELDATLRATGRPMVDLASEGDAGQLSGLQSAYAMARKASTVTRTAVAEYLERRLVPLEERFLDVLRRQLSAIEESPPHQPVLVAEADLKVFRNQVHDMPDRVRAELQEQLQEWYVLADEGGFRSTLDDIVEERLLKTVASLEAEGDRLFETAKRKSS
jgi:hypothetical protein